MATMVSPQDVRVLTLPDHTQLPDEDGTFVKNFQEHPQSILLTEAIRPVLDVRHPDGQYAIGQDCGIYWRLTDPPERGAVSPDWYYVPNVPPLLDGKVRRSYVMWQEYIAPLIVIEFVSDDGAEERDTTPITGKFWIYEQVVRPAFYAIYEVQKGSVEVYRLVAGRYEVLPPNDHGRYPIMPLGVELGIWHGRYLGADLPWLRWWGSDGAMLPTGEERAAQESLRASEAEQRAAQESLRASEAEQRAARLAARLRELGIDLE